ncbi:hypothetical protein AKJ52_01445 [candidate division MSBL1 archaeon SCGC-AAA382C18]|uniref:Uncharacterized protein n=1 Tax=candidate division MSBL1 archaeon SCGC-AAA382C18 TaxID=1698281 RepID=A0A133VK92_9EURY|nr:hypothetical protein AKJ52_01445 [candidate division MSBL1 archaeon SCGC-AAA382C18]
MLVDIKLRLLGLIFIFWKNFILVGREDVFLIVDWVGDESGLVSVASPDKRFEWWVSVFW